MRENLCAQNILYASTIQCVHSNLAVVYDDDISYQIHSSENVLDFRILGNNFPAHRESMKRTCIYGNFSGLCRPSRFSGLCYPSRLQKSSSFLKKIATHYYLENTARKKKQGNVMLSYAECV